MNLKDIIKTLDLKVLTAADRLDVEVSGGYSSDLLSDVMVNGQERNVWVTLQIHENIVAVARLRNLAAIILVNNRAPEPATLKRAEEEHIPLLSTTGSAFMISGKLYALMGIKD